MSTRDLARAPLDRTSLAASIIRPGGPWSSLEVVDTLGSSNETLSLAATSGTASPGAVLVAEEQTAGRGRRGRGWVAPQYSSVMVSVLVQPDSEPARWGWLPLLTALAVVQGVNTLGVEASIKWPNDVLVGEAKLAGVLCEVVQTPTGPAVVAGWGINVDQGVAELPGPEATSVRLAGGVVDRARLLVACLDAWDEWFRRWGAGDATVLTSYHEHSSTLGRAVRVSLPDGGELLGTAVRLDANGSLVLDVDGRERSIAAADVVHLRAPGLPR
jgi:BirA family biotin operon repressor/biotin-[acetyl-CoA-carboxylase] ligase